MIENLDYDRRSDQAVWSYGLDLESKDGPKASYVVFLVQDNATRGFRLVYNKLEKSSSD